MEFSTIWKKVKRRIKKRGIKNTVKFCIKKYKRERGEKLFEILLLTNLDSDNVGDQVIEACDMALLECVMKNLQIAVEDYEISSRPASIVSRKYLETGNENLLEEAEKAIERADIVVFGGAPMFNYLYQKFYERTAVILELIQKYGKTAVFSAIGIEQYDEENPKCQRLKTALNFECVKQITTRDDFDILQKYKENEHMVIGKVSDPAVFSAKVFEPYLLQEKAEKKKKIGVFVLRENGFKSNKIDFSPKQAADFWADLIEELKNKGYGYEILTSGHFSDEAFVDELIRKRGVSEARCVFNMNSPEKLVSRISSYDAVISCRLHPSIIAFALDVPSIGIVWNVKVKGFYSSIGYNDRIVEVGELTPQVVVEKLERAMEQGVEKNEEYMMSVYNSLFAVIKAQICPDKDITPYTYQQLMCHMPSYMGTSQEEQEEKDIRKFRRIYESYNRHTKNFK